MREIKSSGLFLSAYKCGRELWLSEEHTKEKTYTSLHSSLAASSATRMSYSSAAYFSQSDTSWPSASNSWRTWRTGSHEPFVRGQEVVTLVYVAHPYDREGVLLLVLQVLLNVEESVKEDVGQLAPFQVPQSNLTWKGQTIINNQTGEQIQCGGTVNGVISPVYEARFNLDPHILSLVMWPVPLAVLRAEIFSEMMWKAYYRWGWLFPLKPAKQQVGKSSSWLWADR